MKKNVKTHCRKNSMIMQVLQPVNCNCLRIQQQKQQWTTYVIAHMYLHIPTYSKHAVKKVCFFVTELKMGYQLFNIRGFPSSRIWCCIFGWVVYTVPKQHTAFRNHSHNGTGSLPRRQGSSITPLWNNQNLLFKIW